MYQTVQSVLAPEVAAEAAAGGAGGGTRHQQVAALHGAVVPHVRLRPHRPKLPGAAHRQPLLPRHREPAGVDVTVLLIQAPGTLVVVLCSRA